MNDELKLYREAVEQTIINIFSETNLHHLKDEILEALDEVFSDTSKISKPEP